MRRITSLVGVLAAAAALVAVSAAGANAATGRFAYSSPQLAEEVEGFDPEDEQCYLVNGATKVGNHTDSRAVLFQDAACSDTIVAILEPGEELDNLSTPAQSVMFYGE